MSQRWAYHDSDFPTDWPSLPEEVDEIHQVVTGKVGGAIGLWLLTETQLFFARGMLSNHPQNVTFENVSCQLDLEVAADSYIIPRWNNYLFIVSAFNFTYLDCSREE
jgi:hypothetical protein